MVNFIKGGISIDARGQIRYVNEFDMQEVRRFYIIQNANKEIKRGWRGHRIEQRWFYVISGGFEIEFVKVDNWDNPSKTLAIHKLALWQNQQNLLNVPAGYATAFRALEDNSELLVFADYSIEHAKMDDYTWDLHYFEGKKG